MGPMEGLKYGAHSKGLDCVIPTLELVALLERNLD